MSTEPQSATVEWAEDAKPLAICMICNAEFAESETTCPKCQVKLSLVHRCPQCARIVAAKHLRCPYCTRRFVPGNDLESLLESGHFEPQAAGDKQAIGAHDRRQRLKLLFFSLGVFFAVAAATTWVLRLRSGQPLEAVVLGSSYAPHELALKDSISGQTYTTGKLAAGTVVQITGTERDEKGLDWFAVKRDNLTGYVRVDELAPAKGTNAANGYKLLRVSLADMTDPSEASDATQAVELYRRLYPSDSRGDELLWMLAERCRELGVRAHSRQTIASAQKAYQQLVAANGQYSARAIDSLNQLPDFADARTAGRRAKPTNSSIEVIGASGPLQPADPKRGPPHKFMLLNQTKVWVSLPGKQVQAGQLLLATIASDVVTNNEVAVPAGSVCKVRVTGMNAQPSTEDWVGLQLQSLQVGDRTYAVDATPVQLRVSELSLKAGSPVLFQLRRSLILSR